MNVFRNTLKFRENELQKKIYRIRNYIDMEEINAGEN